MAVAVPIAERAAGTIRSRLTAISPDLADDAEEALRTALKATKRVRANRECTKCGCTHVDYVDVQDTPKVLEAIKLAVEQTEGRPGVADQAEQDQLVINRTVYTTVSAEQALALLDAGDLDGLRAELQSSL